MTQTLQNTQNRHTCCLQYSHWHSKLRWTRRSWQWRNITMCAALKDTLHHHSTCTSISSVSWTHYTTTCLQPSRWKAQSSRYVATQVSTDLLLSTTGSVNLLIYICHHPVVYDKGQKIKKTMWQRWLGRGDLDCTLQRQTAVNVGFTWQGTEDVFSI